MTDLDLELHLNDPRHAINFVLDTDFLGNDDADAFLRAWREGDLRDWPEYVTYVKAEVRGSTQQEGTEEGEHQ